MHTVRYKHDEAMASACLPLLAALAMLALLAPFPAASQSVDESVQTDAAAVSPDSSLDDSQPVIQEQPRNLLPPERFSIAGVKDLLNIGTVNLAHDVLSGTVPPRDLEGEWIEWEKLFYETAARVGAWKAIVDRAGDVNKWLPSDLYVLAHSAAVAAQLKLDRALAARERLRHLIWNTPHDPELMLVWRELIIQSYLADRMYDDAQVALADFYRDYRPNDAEWEIRYARVLLLTGRVDQAASRIASQRTLEARLLNLYARYANNSISAEEVLESGLALSAELQEKPQLSAELWTIVAQAAQVAQDTETRVTAAENSLVSSERIEDEDVLAPVVSFGGAEQLLDAYADHALKVGNSYGLVVGDDDSWEQLAQEFEILSPATARAIYSFMTASAAGQSYRAAAAGSLATGLVESGRHEVLSSLLVDEALLSAADIPTETLNDLVNWSLQRRDYLNASRIMIAMQGVPAEYEKYLWELQRARVALHARDLFNGVRLLTDLIGWLDWPVESAVSDRVVQAIFDLQDAEEHETAVELLNELYGKVADDAQRRELLFWLAESHSQLNEHEKAAALFFRSAMMGTEWHDEWGQSSQYRGAEELLSLGHLDDSERVFRTLRRLTADPRKRARIDLKMQELGRIRSEQEEFNE